MYVTIIDKK